MRKLDIKIGDRYNRLTIVEEVYHPKRRTFKCKCDCGNYKIISLTHMRSGIAKSCGCYSIEFRTKHNHAHNDNITSEYTAWSNMKSRCNNPKFKQYKDYGGRGIKVCDRWLNSFKNFIDDMGKKPGPEYSIDRYPNNDGNYEPSNCRWSTSSEQLKNRRKYVRHKSN